VVGTASDSGDEVGTEVSSIIADETSAETGGVALGSILPMGILKVPKKMPATHWARC
jgi:hypothetical protein